MASLRITNSLNLDSFTDSPSTKRFETAQTTQTVDSGVGGMKELVVEFEWRGELNEIGTFQIHLIVD